MGSGEARETWTTAVTLLAAGCSVSLEKLVISTLFNVIFCNIAVVLFLYYNFFLFQYFEEALPPLPPQKDMSLIYTMGPKCL